MEAIILAGGFGTRLQSVVKDLPKPMAIINNRYFLEYILDYIDSYNIFTKVILAVGYKKEIIKEYFKYKYKNLLLEYSDEETPLGTGGAIKKALNQCRDNDVFIFNGDTFFEVNLLDLHKTHNKYNSDITLSLKKMYDFSRYGNVLTEGDFIISFQEKTFTKTGLINAGVFIVKKDIFADSSDIFSFENDILSKKVDSLKFAYIKSEAYFIDIGIPEDYKKANLDFGDKLALFLDRDGIINTDKKYVHKISDFEFVDGIFEVCRFFLDKGYLIFVITNQAGINKKFYNESDFSTLTKWMLDEFKKHNIYITDVFYCPHSDDEECCCRKPKPGMLLEAQNKYNISLKKSILIGDKQSDIDAGKRAGIEENILIKSDYQENYDYITLQEYALKLKKDKN